MKNLEGYPVFIEALGGHYKALREEFGQNAEHLLDVMAHQGEDFIPITKEELLATFDCHFHRFQQVYTMLRYLNVVNEPDGWAVTMTSSPLKRESVLNSDLLVPLIRQYPFKEPLLGVRKETVDFNSFPQGGFEVCTIASLPLAGLEVNQRFRGKTVLLTTQEVWTESMLVNQTDSEISFVWGDTLIDNVVGGLKPPDQKSLN